MRVFSVLVISSLALGATLSAPLRADLPTALAPDPQSPPPSQAPANAPVVIPKNTGTSAQPLPQVDTTEADNALRELVARQNELFAKADAEGDALDLENFRSQMQQLTQRYDKLLRTNEKYVPGYVAYGLLLNKIGMRKEGAALMFKANELDGRLAIVKNQLGNFCAEENRPLEAFVFYTAAIALEPKEPLYYYQLGTLLTEARDTLLTQAPGMWTREKIDEAMQAAFRQAMDLTPGDWRYAYRYGLSYYDLQLGEWEEALQFWEAFETKLKPGIEQQVCRLHEAKVLIELRRAKEAQAKLDTVTAKELATQRIPVAAALAALIKKGDVQELPADEQTPGAPLKIEGDDETGTNAPTAVPASSDKK